MANDDGDLPHCDPLIKYYLRCALGWGAWCSLAFTQYYNTRHRGYPIIGLNRPNLLQRYFTLATIWFLLLLPIPTILIPLFTWPFALWLSWIWFKTLVGNTSVVLLAMSTLVAVGMILPWAKQRYQTIYGAAEFEVGLIACYVGLGKVNDPDQVAVYSIAAGVYLIARGVENTYSGRKAIRAAVKEYKVVLRWASMFWR